MIETEQTFLAEIKKAYDKVKRPLKLWNVVKLGKKLFNSHKKIVSVLKRFRTQGKVKFNEDEGLLIPLLTEEEQQINNNHQTMISPIFIRSVLSHLHRATPNEIVKEYTKLFGMVNSETLTRKIRQMTVDYENGTKDHGIRRHGDEYFLATNLVEKPLGAFC